MAMISVIKPGTQTTVQDFGRPQHQINGFPEAGGMDQQALKTANLLVGNALGAPVLEFVIMGPTLVFDQPTFVAVTGGLFTVKLNGKEVATYRCLQVNANDRLEIGQASAGMFGYLAIRGGLQVKPLMDSAATMLRLHLGGYHGRQLQAGDQLAYQSSWRLSSYYHRHTDQPALPDRTKTTTIRVLKGPQWDDFSSADQKLFASQEYKVTKNVDRMGYRLVGKELTTNLPSMLSEATVRGAVQLTSSGQPIVLMADRQTTGGYPLIAVVASVDLPRFVQCQPGQPIKFQLIELAEASKLLKQQAQQLTDLDQQIQHSRYQRPYGIDRVDSQRIAQLF
ncbi:biotin-dependent carboxyltransferase family protein [Limosilactobacillus sp.]|uniref:5-oxoprolinase subunit C family protein n=1 Tax=Limosilactobacillus sp. TaxID=2773925 RepID=UPI00345E6EAB